MSQKNDTSTLKQPHYYHAEPIPIPNFWTDGEPLLKKIKLEAPDPDEEPAASDSDRWGKLALTGWGNSTARGGGGRYFYRKLKSSNRFF